MLLGCNHFIVSIFNFPEYTSRPLDRLPLEVPLGVLAFEQALVCPTVELLVIKLHPFEKTDSFLTLIRELCLCVHFKSCKSDELTLSPVILPQPAPELLPVPLSLLDR